MKVMILMLTLLTQLFAAQKNYPAHWWAEISKQGAPEWEILPQQAKKGEVVLSKRHELGLLSNFAATPFELRGKKYASIEGLWQSMLYPENDQDPRASHKSIHWKFRRAEVEQMTGFEAKAAGELAKENMRQMKINWVSFENRQFDYITKEKGEHYKIIYEALKAKVVQNKEVKKVLLATKGLKLIPDHHQEKEASPAWKYNLMLMEIRDQLK